jgi:hypothetical protein
MGSPLHVYLRRITAVTSEPSRLLLLLILVTLPLPVCAGAVAEFC